MSGEDAARRGTVFAARSIVPSGEQDLIDAEAA